MEEKKKISPPKIFSETEPIVANSLREKLAGSRRRRGWGGGGGRHSVTCRDDYKFKLKLIIVFVLIRTAACGSVHLRLEVLPAPFLFVATEPAPRKPTTLPPLLALSFATTPVNFARGISTLINRYLSARFLRTFISPCSKAFSASPSVEH